ncbi:MAG: DUF2391 family protein [Candidatus Aenigmatarchaeota archaeon]
MPRKRNFSFRDTAHQIVGGFLLAGPFVVTGEVWDLAANMSPVQTLITVAIVLGIGYGALYRADTDRDPEKEKSFLGVPLRFISLIIVTYLSVSVLAFTFSAPETFGASDYQTFRALSISAIFSVVGAASADSLF